MRDAFEWQWDPLPSNPEHIRILGDWPLRNIVRTNFPLIGRALNVHKDFAKPLQAFLEDVESAGLLHELGPCNGAWVPRFVRQSGTLTQRKAKAASLALQKRTDRLSNHSWGTAVDFDARRYPLGYRPPLKDPRWELAKIARRHGMRCGIEYNNRPDAMHFELL